MYIFTLPNNYESVDFTRWSETHAHRAEGLSERQRLQREKRLTETECMSYWLIEIEVS